jgi:hypothetical protein
MKSIFEGMGLESLFGVFSGFVDDITKYLRDSKDPFSKAVYELLVSEQNRVKPTATPTPAEGEVAPEGEKKEEEKAGEGVKYEAAPKKLNDLVLGFTNSNFTKLNEKKAGDLGFLSDSDLKENITNIYTELQKGNQTPNYSSLIKIAGEVLKDLKANLPDAYKNITDSKLIKDGKVFLPEGVGKLTDTDNNKKLLELYTVILGVKTGMESKVKTPEAKVEAAPEATKAPNKIAPASLIELKGKTIEATEESPKSVNFNFVDANSKSIPCSLLLAADIGQRTISKDKTAEAASLLTVGDNVYKIEAEFTGRPFVAFSAAVFNPEGTKVTLTAGAPRVQGVGEFKPGAPLPLANLETFIAGLANNKPSSENLDVNDADGKKQKLIFTKIS